MKKTREKHLVLQNKDIHEIICYYRIRAIKRTAFYIFLGVPERLYIQILYVLFKFFQLEHRIFEYTATLEPSKIYRTLSF